ILAGFDLAQRQQIARSAQFGNVFVDFLLVDWSGDPNVVMPQLEPGTVSMFFRSFDAVPCVAATVVSEKAGLAQFKLVVTANMSLATGSAGFTAAGVFTLSQDLGVAGIKFNWAGAPGGAGGRRDRAGGPGNGLGVLGPGKSPLDSN